ncbi:MAG: hypothetical protein ACSHWY_02510 [Octadecabacter sp.]
MTSIRINLENFEADNAFEIGESPEYHRGFAAALLEVEASQAAELAQSVAAISSTLTDMAFGFEEARLHLLNRLSPLLGQLAETILPQLAQESFGAHLKDVVEGAFETVSSAPLTIAVSPDVIPSLKALTATKQFEFVPDPALRAGQAFIGQGDTHVLLDLAALTTELQAVLNGIEHSERSVSHG